MLLAELGSVVEELTVAVSLMAVPAAVPAVTFKITGKLTDPDAKLGSVQLIVPVLPAAGRVQDQPAGMGVNDTKVVLAGVASVKVTPVAVLGPALVTTWV